MTSKTGHTFTAGPPKIRKHFSGCYRLTLDDNTFAQIKREGRKWSAEIRATYTGSLIRPAGIWSTRREAIEEVRSIAS